MLSHVHLHGEEKDLEQTLGEAFAFADQANYEKQYMESVLRQQGIDPWALPNSEEHQE